jgi:hypothetical protein
VEPQRTNLLTYSNDFTNGWTGSGITGTANYGVAPDGTNTSTRLVFSGANRIWLKSISNLIGNNGVFSLYIKGVVGQTILITYAGTTDKTITLLNGWNRYNVNGLGVSNNIFINTFGGATARDIEVWGGQVELGSYATSYIPTVASTITRNADVISKTGISSLIGQTEGTVFVDVNLNSRVTQTYFAISSSATLVTNYIGISFRASTIVLEVVTGTFLQASHSLSNSLTGRFKLGIAYKNNDFAFYANGVQLSIDNSGTVPACKDIVLFNSTYSQNQALNYNSVQLYKTRLSNTELQSLTTL